MQRNNNFQLEPSHYVSMKKCNEYLNIDIKKWPRHVRTELQKMKFEIVGMCSKVRLLVFQQ